ncbi:MAG: hypothetical protein H7039_23675 [Bryobacteraceae bacterium]|nr:hypothetical protein [Bryobacteraceae bacterium]
MPRRWLRSIAILAFMAAVTLGAPPLTKIQDLLYKANGTLFDGVAEIQWISFTTPDGTVVPPNTISVRVIRGQLRVSLMPTVLATPAISYTVRFTSEGKTQFTEYWAVPASSTSLKLANVRMTGGTAGNLSTGIAGILDVAGLRTELDLRPAKGPRWTANHAATITASGTLEAVIGADQDCVRVDGTSGPCGAPLTFVDGEVPSGATDGLNRDFQMSALPMPLESLRIFRNGMLMNSSEYQLTGNVITISENRIPQPSDILQVWYRTSGAVISMVDAEIPAGSVNGLNPRFTLASPPIPAASLQIYRNGILQRVGVDYKIAANTITFLPYSVPGAGDILFCTYRK